MRLLFSATFLVMLAPIGCGGGGASTARSPDNPTAQSSDQQATAAEIAEAHRLSPDGRYSSIARLKAVGYLGVPKVRELFTIYLDGYRKAGVREE